MSRFKDMDIKPVYISFRSNGQDEHGAVPKKLCFNRESMEQLLVLIAGGAKNAFWRFYDGRPEPDRMAVKLKSGRGIILTKPSPTHLGIQLQEKFCARPKLAEEEGLVLTWQVFREFCLMLEGWKAIMEKTEVEVKFPYGTLCIEIGKEYKPDTVNLMGEKR